MTDAPSLPTLAPRRLGATILRLPFALRTLWPDYPQARAVLHYWEELRADRPAPSRAEVDPRRLGHALESCFVAELVAPRVARLRIAGQHLNALLGMEARGMVLSTFFAGPARDELGLALEQVEQGVRVQMPLRAEGGLGKPRLDGLLVLMPMTDGLGRISRILGVLETQGQIGRTPRRFRQVDGAATDFAPPPTRTAATTHAPAGGRPQLRVLTGGRA